jgi:RHS repeat-associated protein
MNQEGAWGVPPHANRYQYNGKELNEDLGVNWYAYGFRYYDAALARFTGVDPLAEQMPELSVYNYASNSPIGNIDLHGLQAFSIHGTNSDPTTFDNMSDEDFQSLTGNSTVNRCFEWPKGTNGFTNNEKDRGVAAEALANYVLKNLSEGQDITLVGHSHGGNVAIQAVDKIQAGLDETGDTRSISLITIATPAYNQTNDIENPANTSIDNHTHFYSGSDAVQTTLADAMGTKTAARTYSNPITTNIKVEDTKKIQVPDTHNPGMTRTVVVPTSGPIGSHSIHQNPKLLHKN